MPLTLSQVEVKLTGRFGYLLSQLGLDGTTADGTNATLAEPIRIALTALGLPTATPGEVTDADLDSLDPGELTKFLDVAAYFALDVAWSKAVFLCDQSLGSESQSLSQIAKGIKDRMDALMARIGYLVIPSSVPGPSAHGLIRAGRCYPVRETPHYLPWRGGWCG